MPNPKYVYLFKTYAAIPQVYVTTRVLSSMKKALDEIDHQVKLTNSLYQRTLPWETEKYKTEWVSSTTHVELSHPGLIVKVSFLVEKVRVY